MKFIPILLLLFLKDYSAYAQNRSFGVIASAGVGNISYPVGANPPAEFKNPLQSSFQAGVFLENKFTKHSSLFIAGSFWSQRAKWILYYHALDYSVYKYDFLQTSLGYLAVPASYLYHFHKLRLLVGLQGGWLLRKNRVEDERYNHGSTVFYGHSEYSDIDIQNFDLGITAGIHYEIIPNLFAGSNIYYGLSNASKESFNILYPEHIVPKIHNFNISAIIGFQIVRFGHELKEKPKKSRSYDIHP